MNKILNKFGSTDPENILNLINPDDPDYLVIAIKHKKYNRLLKDDLLKYKTEICKELETEIVSRYYFQKGRIESNIKNDKDIYQAKLLLSDSFKTETILSKIEKPTKPFNIKKKF